MIAIVFLPLAALISGEAVSPVSALKSHRSESSNNPIDL